MAFSKDACLEKERVRSKVTLRKAEWQRAKRGAKRGEAKRGVEQEVGLQDNLVKASHLLGLSGRHQYSNQLQSN